MILLETLGVITPIFTPTLLVPLLTGIASAVSAYDAKKREKKR